MNNAKPLKLYLAGKMRGIPKYNFPAFNHYAARLRATGFEIISPAEMDLDVGFTENDPEPGPQFLKEAIKRDIDAILECDGIALIPGWEGSLGVKVEMALARFLGLKVINAETLEDVTA